MNYKGLLAVMGMSLGVTAQTPRVRSPIGSSPAIVAEGHTIYNQTCTACHGMDGQAGELAPALVGDRRFFRITEGSLYDTIKHGIAGTSMPAFTIPDENIWKIIAYIRAMRSSAWETDVPGNVEHGVEVFAGKGGCTQCHVLNGKGGTIGPNLSNVGATITLKRLQETLTMDGPIPAGYQPLRVVTRKGETIEGVAKNQDDFSIQMLDRQNHLHLLNRSELQTVEESKVSLMPHNYDQVLTKAEYNDLLAMLAKQVTMAVRKGREVEGDGDVGR